MNNDQKINFLLLFLFFATSLFEATLIITFVQSRFTRNGFGSMFDSSACNDQFFLFFIIVIRLLAAICFFIWQSQISENSKQIRKFV